MKSRIRINMLSALTLILFVIVFVVPFLLVLVLRRRRIAR